MSRSLALVVALLLACVAPAAAAPWLFVSDIHFDPASPQVGPVHTGGLDSNRALLDSAIAAMHLVDPHPPVVVVGGDELAHNFAWSHAAATMAYIAHRLDRAFPDAQFVMTLGNEDSSCGDYEVGPHSAFLRDVARAWEPLVNRGGAAPDFATTFARDGFYVARLPVAHLRAVVIDDVFWSPRYRQCAPDGDPSVQTLVDAGRALRVPGERHWVLMHIPPGIDAFSTAHLAHGLAVVPFLNPQPREAFAQIIADPRSHVALALAAHTHKLAYRIAGTTDRPVPILLLPSISPIFNNAPGFLTANVDPDGTLRDVDSYAFDGHRWNELGGLRALGVDRVTGDSLADLHRRLAHDPALRARFARLYEGGAAPEIDARNWPIYWCSATMSTVSAFRACTNAGGTSLLTRRGVVAVVAALVACTVVAFVLMRRLMRRRA